MDKDNDYSDIIDLPHYQIKSRTPMPIQDRAMSFSSFRIFDDTFTSSEKQEPPAEKQEEEYDDIRD
ncbi:MAG: hypothetical protein J5698_04665 [Bacteroidaceae bacterium]|nr:hypothetical protein [Bacteroidaceae bacterium]